MLNLIAMIVCALLGLVMVASNHLGLATMDAFVAIANGVIYFTKSR